MSVKKKETTEIEKENIESIKKNASVEMKNTSEKESLKSSSKTKKTKSTSKTKKKVDKKKILIIVESPTKIKSLSKYLGPKYLIDSSKGHLIDLPKSRMGIDIENNFTPDYITIRGKGKTLMQLRRRAKQAKMVLLATDPDREGEAIGWHLHRALSKVNDNIQRIVFNEITKEAIIEAVKNPKSIDMGLVNAQQGRRLLDRLVGYSVSPVLQEKFGSKRFSAGRVQSVALKIICDREDEIEKFVPEEYWELEATWSKTEGKTKVKDKSTFFKFAKYKNKKVEIHNGKEVDTIEEELNKRKFLVSLRHAKERNVKPQAPYMTSKLQQEASTRLGFRVQKTMSVAQSLYEGVELKNKQVTGLITYMRTDSTRISDSGVKMARDYIKDNYTDAHLPEAPIVYAGKKAAQDAHEAIRPTNVSNSPDQIKRYLSPDQFKLYSLIWGKFVASQMTKGIDELTTIEISDIDNEFLFRYSASYQKFKGFREVFPTGDNKKNFIPDFQKDESMQLEELNKIQKFTQPPPRYTEASLIKIMEESGIGRPATYVPTIGTLDKRGYIERKGRQLSAAMLGRVVNDMMKKHFVEIVDINFTATMEEKLDLIADGKENYQQMLENFYVPFKDVLTLAYEEMEDQNHLIRIPTGRTCPKCEEGEVIKKLGKNGFFFGCSRFQEGCRYAQSVPLGKCPLCGGNVVSKKSKKGRTFYGCENYSTTGCEFSMMIKPAKKTCPKCDSIMGQKVKKSGITYLCQKEDCKFVLEESTEE